MNLDRNIFDNLVEEAIASLPPLFQKYLTNVEIAVKDEPSPEVLERTRIRGRSLLLGVFIGVPKTKKRPYHTVVSLPDRIELYQKNIEAVCSTPEEIKRQIQDTIKHEIGHYFGLSERELRET